MRGLSYNDVEYRKNNNMVNNQKVRTSRSIKSILFSNIFTLFNFIHLILFILVLTTGCLNNATFVFTILFNMLISIRQELKAKKILDKLSITNIAKVIVIRDSKEVEINANEIVLDDILYLKQGDCLIVDALIVDVTDLEVDESVITGESDSVLKTIGDKLISGSIIVSGIAYAKVISINGDTYANNLISEASKMIEDSSYLNKCINFVLKIVTVLIIPVGFLLFFTQFFCSGQSYSEAILSSVAGIIGMIPEGLVLLTSISLTVGVVKIASKKVIVQKLSGIEMLACIDIFCLDKTGTITDGSMEVVDVIEIKQDVNFKSVISTMVSERINATDISLFNYFKNNNSIDVLERIPFSSSRKYALVKFEFGIYALGALEYITNKEFDDFDELTEYLASGYRIISLARCINDFDKNTNEIIAFVILKDKVRKNVKEIFEYFNKQDIDIKIISGDNPKMISNLMKQINILGFEKYISGNKLPENYNELKEIIKKYNIFGRVTPYQKQKIIRILKENAMVGMIGDGVNDILALKEADCGIALANGISAARNVSEIVLTESDFSVLPIIVNEGRRVVNNIERVASMYLIKTIYSFLLSVLCIVIGHEYPFYPVQLTLIGCTCVGLPSFFLTLEPNYNKVKKNFIIKVFKNAISSGLCVFCNVFFLIILSYLFNFKFEFFRLTIVVITGYLNLRLLYKICKPLSLFRKILFYFCSFLFLSLLFIFNNFFIIKSYNIFSFLFIFILIYIDSYLSLFFEKIYDKIVLWIQSIKRSKIDCEK